MKFKTKKNKIAIKYLKLLLLTTLCLLLIISCKKNNKANIVSGAFVGTADSLLGRISVEVVLNKNKIKHISVIEYSGTPSYTEAVFKYLPNKVISKNSTDTDAITGATVTSDAFLRAVEDALQKAGQDNFNVFH